MEGGLGGRSDSLHQRGLGAGMALSGVSMSGMLRFTWSVVVMKVLVWRVWFSKLVTWEAGEKYLSNSFWILAVYTVSVSEGVRVDGFLR